MKQLIVTVGVLFGAALLFRASMQFEFHSQLRIANVGVYDIENLEVLFPESEVEFGDLLVGSTTEYEEVVGGVYSYAAFRLDVEGESLTQGVTDWLGAEPIAGDSFTYEVSFDPTRDQPLELVEVRTDE